MVGLTEEEEGGLRVLLLLTEELIVGVIDPVGE